MTVLKDGKSMKVESTDMQKRRWDDDLHSGENTVAVANPSHQ
jgi:hypothetical protein